MVFQKGPTSIAYKKTKIIDMQIEKFFQSDPREVGQKRLQELRNYCKAKLVYTEQAPHPYKTE